MGDGGVVGSQRAAVDLHPGAPHRFDRHGVQAGEYTGPHREEQQISTEPLHLERSTTADASFGRSLALVRYLRDHCDWDARQTPTSLLPYLLEEAHETADAVRRGDDCELRGELGDLLLNVAYQVVLGEERGAFSPDAVVSELERKMIARHPHVYGDADTPPDWETLKAEERAARAGSDARSADDDPLVGIPSGLEPLSRALRVQERAAAVGFDWPDAFGAMAKLREEIDELEALLARDESGQAVFVASPSSAGTAPDPAVVEEAGDLLFAVINVCRLAGAHPLTALDGATAKFARRFRDVFARARAADLPMPGTDLETLDELWDAVKSAESSPTD